MAYLENNSWNPLQYADDTALLVQVQQKLQRSLEEIQFRAAFSGQDQYSSW